MVLKYEISDQHKTQYFRWVPWFIGLDVIPTHQFQIKPSTNNNKIWTNSRRFTYCLYSQSSTNISYNFRIVTDQVISQFTTSIRNLTNTFLLFLHVSKTLLTPSDEKWITFIGFYEILFLKLPYRIEEI